VFNTNAKTPGHFDRGSNSNLSINSDGHHPAAHRNPQEGLVYADCRTEAGIPSPTI
jgi:hypothetical protein